jgi:hypothetical protein
MTELAACTSEQELEACPEIAGNYSVTVTRLSGTCDASLDPATSSFSMVRNDDGTYTATLPGIAGGCAGTLDKATCKFRSACEVRGSSNELVLTTNLDYTFNSKGYSGTSVSGISPPTVATRCEVTYRETGNRL